MSTVTRINLISKLYKSGTDGYVSRIFKDVTKITITYIVDGGIHFLTRVVDFQTWPSDLNGSTVFMHTFLEGSPYYFTPQNGTTAVRTGLAEWTVVGFDIRGYLAFQCNIAQWARPDFPNPNDITLYYAQFTVGHEVISKVINNSISIKTVNDKCNQLLDDIDTLKKRIDAQDALIDTAFKDVANCLARINAVEAKFGWVPEIRLRPK